MLRHAFCMSLRTGVLLQKEYGDADLVASPGSVEESSEYVTSDAQYIRVAIRIYWLILAAREKGTCNDHRYHYHVTHDVQWIRTAIRTYWLVPAAWRNQLIR